MKRERMIAELQAAGLLTYDDLPPVVRRFSAKRLLELAPEGKFPAPVSMPPPTWLAGEVIAWIEAKAAEAQEGKA